MKRNLFKGRIAYVLLLIVVGACVSLKSALPTSQAQYPVEPVFIEPGLKELASSRQSMVSSSHPFATNAGLEMLRRGGNALDAAIAATFVLAVVDHGLTSFAGGGALTYYEAKTKRTISINFDAVSFREEVMPYSRERHGTTGRSIRLPGTFAGLHLALQKYGKLSWKQVLEPAIFYAENGFPIHGHAYATMRRHYNTLTLRPSGRRIFAPDGFLPPVGSVFKQLELAETLKKIAEQGPDYFYKGPFAEQMVKAIQEIGGKATLEDFASYRPMEIEPVRGTYKNYELMGPPPPDIGPVGIIEGMNILENVDLKSLGHYSESADSLQWLIETLRVVDARKFTGIPEWDRSLAQVVTSKEYARSRYELIRYKIEQLKRQASDTPEVAAATPPWEEYEKHENTNNVSVVDKEGNLCSITNTIYGAVYSFHGLFVGGLVLNSGGGHPALPGKRMLNPKAPMLVFKDGKPYFAAGSSGGIPNPFFLIVNTLVWDKNFKEAQEVPRFRVASSFYTDWGMNAAGPENRVQIEHRIDEKIVAELKKRGYQVEWAAPYSMRNAQLAGLDPNSEIRYGASDPRGLGQAAGQ